MEIIAELILQFFAEVCCEVLVAAVLDGLTTYAGFKTYQRRAEASHGGGAPPPDDSVNWSRIFWILLPFAVFLTAFVIGIGIWKHAR